MSWATWCSDARRLHAVDRAHRAARQSRIVGSQLVPIGRISTFLTVCFALGIGSLMLLPVDSDVPENVPAIAGVMMAVYAPFAGVWLKLTDFERLHAPPAGLLLLRLRRLSPYLALIGALWGAMLWNGGGSGVAIAAIVVMPFALSVGNMLRNGLAGLVLRGGIAATFLIGWIDLVPWLPAVSLLLSVVVAAWFVRDLGVYDRVGFAIDPQVSDGLAGLREEIADERELPDVRTAPRRTLFGSAWFVAVAAQRDLPGLWKRHPIGITLSNLLVVTLWLAPVWFAALAVWQSAETVAAVWCILSAVVSLAVFTLEPTEQLYLWGVDAREVERQNLLARLLTVALPALAAAAAVAAWLDGGGARWIAVLMLLGAHLSRVGIVAFNLGTRLLLLVALVVAMSVLGAGRAMDAEAALWMAVALVAFGLVGVVLRLLRSENALRGHAFA